MDLSLTRCSPGCDDFPAARLPANFDPQEVTLPPFSLSEGKKRGGFHFLLRSGLNSRCLLLQGSVYHLQEAPFPLKLCRLAVTCLFVAAKLHELQVCVCVCV